MRWAFAAEARGRRRRRCGERAAPARGRARWSRPRAAPAPSRLERASEAREVLEGERLRSRPWVDSRTFEARRQRRPREAALRRPGSPCVAQHLAALAEGGADDRLVGGRIT